MSGPGTAGVLRALILAAVVAVSGAIPAWAATPDSFMGNPFNPNQVLAYRWGTGAVPPATIKTAINAAVDDANTTRRSKAPTFAYDASGTNTIAYGVSAPCGVNGLACFRRDSPTWFAVYLRENGHQFDWGTLRWCEATDRPNGCYDAENITLDELGHVLGLDHHENLPDDSDYGDAVVQTYSRTKPDPFYNAHGFGRCDVATLQRVYDVLAPSTPYSTCLDVATALSMTAARTSVVAGAVVTFTATLESAGAGKLSDNAISGRVVVLQQRTASTWADLATMAPASPAGSYSVAVVLRDTRDLRAVFRKPTGEGLRGSTSAAVTVSVTPACTSGMCPSSIGPGSLPASTPQ
jgi:hypothetical protein